MRLDGSHFAGAQKIDVFVRWRSNSNVRRNFAARRKNEPQFRENEKECDKKRKAAIRSHDSKLREKEEASISDPDKMII